MITEDDQHIFIVDDEPKIGRAVKETLGQTGATVSCFDRAKDCLDQLASQGCDLLIADLRMPEMDGIGLLRRARVIAPGVPVLILTGYGDVPTAVEAMKAGAVDFVEKPLDKRRFLKTVEAILHASQSRAYDLPGERLTRSEKRVLRLVLEGKSNQEIADLLNRSRRTIEVHRANVMRKLRVENVVDLVKMACFQKLPDQSSSSFEQELFPEYVLATMEEP